MYVCVCACVCLTGRESKSVAVYLVTPCDVHTQEIVPSHVTHRHVLYNPIYHINLHVDMRTLFQIRWIQMHSVNRDMQPTLPPCTWSASGFFKFHFIFDKHDFSQQVAAIRFHLPETNIQVTNMHIHIYAHRLTVSYNCKWVSSYTVTHHCIMHRKV